MGRDLIHDEIAFRDNIRSMDAVLQSLGHDSPDWSIEDMLCSLTDAKALSSADLSQPLCTAIQIALVDFLGSQGVTPSAVVGHSSGEIAAAYAAGALSKESALRVAYYRGFVCRKPVKAGGMAALGLGAGEVSSFIQAGVEIACENSSMSVTISGDSHALDEAMDAIKSKHESAFMRRLVVKTAYHSDHMRLVGNEYRKLIAPHMEVTVPIIPFYSSVYGGRILTASTDFDAQYWQQNLENPVLFHTAVKALLRDCPAMIHTEIGPHSALLGPLRQIYQETGINVQYVPTLIRGHNDTRALPSALGSFFTAGMSISVPSKPDQPPCVLTDLPAYPWFYERPYWTE